MEEAGINYFAVSTLEEGIEEIKGKNDEISLLKNDAYKVLNLSKFIY